VSRGWAISVRGGDVSFEIYLQNRLHLQEPEASRVVGVNGELLRCVWSNHPHHNLDCRACIPADVVATAWQSETEEYGTQEGFFYFSWNDGVWLAYGFRDRRVRGVYCPTHCVERMANRLRPAQPSAREVSRRRCERIA
jgi:hypothetical protein